MYVLMRIRVFKSQCRNKVIMLQFCRFQLQLRACTWLCNLVVYVKGNLYKKFYTDYQWSVLNFLYRFLYTKNILFLEILMKVRCSLETWQPCLRLCCLVHTKSAHQGRRECDCTGWGRSRLHIGAYRRRCSGANFRVHPRICRLSVNLQSGFEPGCQLVLMLSFIGVATCGNE